MRCLHESSNMLQNEEDLLVQLAWLYYVGNKNQEEIAQLLGLSRFKINRMLARAREKGLVKITIEHEMAHSLAIAACGNPGGRPKAPPTL